jgi:hypothetical protein
MSAKGNPYDNAKAESCCKTVKREEVYLKEYTSFADAEANLACFIEDICNVERLHSALDYRPPSELSSKRSSNATAIRVGVIRVVHSIHKETRKGRETAITLDCPLAGYQNRSGPQGSP